MTLIQILEDASLRAQQIAEPQLVVDIYRNVPQEQELDRKNSLAAVCDELGKLDKPFVSVTGPYSAGKTFLVQNLLECDILKSRIEPTTSAITIFRHLSSRPETWSMSDTVFALKPGVDPRSLDPEAIAESGCYEDIARLTTYGGEAMCDAVVVFLESELLKKITLLDCPGVGTLAEAEMPESMWQKGLIQDLLHTETTREEKRTAREHVLQATAMRCSDAFLVLSSMAGNMGAFSDSSTAQVLGELAKHIDRFPSSTQHSNILFVGSQADPTRDGLQDEAETLRIARNAILKQSEHLPQSLAVNINSAVLSDRAVLFFALDPVQRETGIQDFAEAIKPFRPDASPEQLLADAKAGFETRIDGKVRTKAFSKAFHSMIEMLEAGMEDLRAKRSQTGLTSSTIHFSGKRATLQARAKAKKEMEVLSRKYEREQEERDGAWQEIASRGSRKLRLASEMALDDFIKEFSVWEDKAYVRGFLKEQYTDKDQAKEFAPTYIQDFLSERLKEAMTSRVRTVEDDVMGELKSFDRTYLSGTQGEFRGIAGLSEVREETSALSHLSSVSALSTFTAITAGIAGSTTLLAVAGSSLATAALTKLVLFGVTVAGTLGIGAAVSGLLLGIPVYGWVLLGLSGLWKVFRYFATPWQDMMAETIAKSARKNHADTRAKAQEIIEKYFTGAESLVNDSLADTKAIIDGHIQQVHEVAKGSISSESLADAAYFYGQHADLAGEARSALNPEVILEPSFEAIAA